MSKPLIETTAEKVALHDNAAHSLAHRRELARRHSGGFEVTLYWSPDDNITSVEISQPATEEPLLFNVPRARALDAFYHPFSHLTARGFVFADAGASAEGERWNATL